MRSIGCVSKPVSASGRGQSARLAPDTAHGGSSFIRTTGFVLIAASLGGCAQTSAVSQRAGHFAPSREAFLAQRHELRPVHKPVSVVRLHEPEYSEPTKRIALASTGGSHGLASFYREGQETASGERFDPHELTAAHPSLPFGTRLQVTNMATGKSVTVRVNDRGPFVKGRVVDVSYSAAQALGMVHSGVANVKVDVVR